MEEAKGEFDNYLNEIQTLAKTKIKILCACKDSIEEKLQEALKTIRELDRFNNSQPVNFYWPTI